MFPKCFQNVSKMFPNLENMNKCVCGKTYKTRSGLWKHKKTCLHYTRDNSEEKIQNTKLLDVRRCAR
jgi:hypothetical protein